MKTFILFLTWIGVSAYAHLPDYNSSVFESCYNKAIASLNSASAANYCEIIHRDRGLEIFGNRQFNRCYDLNYATLNSLDSINKCLKVSDDEQLEAFSDSQFLKCHELYKFSYSSAKSVDTCLHHWAGKKMHYFSNSVFLKCYQIRNKAYSSAESIDVCLREVQLHSAEENRSLTLEQVNRNIQVPSGTQIILDRVVEIPYNKACVASKVGEREGKCWICRERESVEDVMYRLTKDAETGVAQRILPVESTELSTDGKEIHFKIQRDPVNRDSDDLNLIICNNKKPYQIQDKKELIPLAEKNGLKLIIPEPKVK